MDWLLDSVPDLRTAYARERQKPLPSWAVWDTVRTPGRDIRILVHTPPGQIEDALIVYFHGGGWIVGSPETHADITATLSLASRRELISVDYGLAPEHMAPSVVNDGVRVLEHVLAREADLPSPRQVILCGDSAGAAIAMAVERGVRPDQRAHIVGVCSLYGAFGPFNGKSPLTHGSRNEGTDRDCLQRYWSLAHRNAVPSPYSIDHLSQFSPVPAYLLSGYLDPLRDGTHELAARFKANGRPLTVDVVKAEGHGFLHGEARSVNGENAIVRICEWFTGISK